jgi:hypothetical protein
VAPAQVAHDFADGVHAHQGRAVDAPELVRVEFGQQFLERLADQEFGVAVCTRVYFSSDWKNSTSRVLTMRRLAPTWAWIQRR